MRLDYDSNLTLESGLKEGDLEDIILDINAAPLNHIYYLLLLYTKQ